MIILIILIKGLTMRKAKKRINQAIVKRTPSGELILFFHEYITKRGGLLASWQEVGQHGEASLSFYHLCKIVSDKEAKEFLDLYHKQYDIKGNDRYSLRKRLNYNSLTKI